MLELTPAQAKVLEAWADNGRLKGAARKLGLSVRTVEAHVGRAAADNHLANTGLLLVRYVRHGAVVRKITRGPNRVYARNPRSAFDRHDELILRLAARPQGATSVGVAREANVSIDWANKRMAVLVANETLIRDTLFRPYVYKVKPNGNEN